MQADQTVLNYAEPQERSSNFVEAIYSFQAQLPDDLGFHVGEYLEIIDSGG
jgi:hypothetical protein